MWNALYLHLWDFAKCSVGPPTVDHINQMTCVASYCSVIELKIMSSHMLFQYMDIQSLIWSDKFIVHFQ